MDTKRMIRKLWMMFPRKIALKYHDYVGMMHKGLKDETHRVVLCLDCDEAVIDKAIECHADIIISHHPFIYGTLKKVLNSDPIKQELYERLDLADIPVYSFHTNFDEGARGMNDALAEKLELTAIHHGEDSSCMRIGTLPCEMNIYDFAKYAKEKLNVPYGLLIDEGKKNIKTVAIIGGGGAGYYLSAIKDDADIYISGDAPHHIRRDIVARHYNYLDLPHEIEKVFMPQMKKILLEMDPSLEIIIVDDQKLPKLI